uniref:Transposase n=1 Tax=Heterorhabditis bacteriophora TaxID=37862 RepID=A0A1I7WZQ6_HETBA
MWTNKSGKIYLLAVSAHYVNKEWDRKNIIIAAKHFVRRHTGEEMTATIENTLEEMSVTDIVGLTTDSVVSMKKTARLLKIEQITGTTTQFLRDIILSDMKQRFTPIWESKQNIVATSLDPRFYRTSLMSKTDWDLIEEHINENWRVCEFTKIKTWRLLEKTARKH